VVSKGAVSPLISPSARLQNSSNTSYGLIGFKKRFEALADERGKAKSTLLDEAIGYLLNKNERPDIEEIPHRH
jgi:hypothetical protein